MRIVKKICNFLSGRNDRLEALQEARTIVKLLRNGNHTFADAQILCGMVEAEDTLKFIYDSKMRNQDYESDLRIIDNMIRKLEKEME